VLPEYAKCSRNPQIAPPPKILNCAKSGFDPIRIPYPSEAGEQNNFRGDGYFAIDSGVSKSWSVPERHNLKSAWEVFK
jgi:hypothetical protein